MFAFALIVSTISLITQLKLNTYKGWHQRTLKSNKEITKKKKDFPENTTLLQPQIDPPKSLEYKDFYKAYNTHKIIIQKAFISNIFDFIVVPAIMFSLRVTHL